MSTEEVLPEGPRLKRTMSEMPEEEEKRTIDLGKLPKLYFNMYVAAIVRNRPDCEAINCDLLYFVLLMKMNHYAKEVYFRRKDRAPEKELDAIYGHLTMLRKFIMDFYEIAPPKWQMIQNEREDPLSELDKLPVEEDPFGDKKSLSEMTSRQSSSSAPSEEAETTPSFAG